MRLKSNASPQLCAYEECTACTACFNICPQQAIAMTEGTLGELHPLIDMDKCIRCHLCEKVCPELESNSLSRNDSPEVYYCWLKDSLHRRESTSGGAAFAISQAIIHKGGHVWGAAYDENLIVRYTEANTIEELAPLQKSKYIQSCVGSSFKEIKKELDQGDYVLFTGTSCHVKGLRSFLHKDYDNLFTIDLICHGVPGHGVFQKYKRWIEKKYNDRMVNYVPRYKNKSGIEVSYYAMVTFENKGEQKMVMKDNAYLTGFENSLFLRDSCHHCTSNGKNRYSDFTIGDFWGLGKLASFTQNTEKPRGISMLALNTIKAKKLMESMQDSIIFEKRSYAEASLTNTPYYKSAIPSKDREEFKKEWMQLSWGQIADKYCRYSGKEMLFYVVKRLIPPTILIRIKSILGQIK